MLKQTLNKGISTPIAIGIVLILVIVVGGFTWWQYGEMWRETSELPEVELPEKEEVKDRTADWETYRNEEHGFETKYPLSAQERRWGCESCFQQIEFPNFKENINIGTLILTIEKMDDLSFPLNYEMITLSNKEFYFNHIFHTDTDNETADFFRETREYWYAIKSKNQEAYILFLFHYECYENERVCKTDFSESKAMEFFNQILSTFRFID